MSQIIVNIVLLLLMIIGPVRLQLTLPFNKHFAYDTRLKNSILFNSTKTKTFPAQIFLTITTKMNLLFSRTSYLHFIDYLCNCKKIVKRERMVLFGSPWSALIISRSILRKQKLTMYGIDTRDF